jgi:hypothetical protein
MALWSTQPLTEMSTRNLRGGNVRQTPKADNLTAICEPTVYRKYVSLDVSQPCGLSHSVTGIPLPLSIFYKNLYLLQLLYLQGCFFMLCLCVLHMKC